LRRVLLLHGTTEARWRRCPGRGCNERVRVRIDGSAGEELVDPLNNDVQTFLEGADAAPAFHLRNATGPGGMPVPVFLLHRLELRLV